MSFPRSGWSEKVDIFVEVSTGLFCKQEKKKKLKRLDIAKKEKDSYLHDFCIFIQLPLLTLALQGQKTENNRLNAEAKGLSGNKPHTKPLACGLRLYAWFISQSTASPRKVMTSFPSTKTAHHRLSMHGMARPHNACIRHVLVFFPVLFNKRKEKNEAFLSLERYRSMGRYSWPLLGRIIVRKMCEKIERWSAMGLASDKITKHSNVWQ